MYPRYLGPMIVIRRNKGGSYILSEMSGAVWQEKVGAFRVIPYFARKQIELPENIHELIDISAKTLKALEESTVVERPNYGGKDLIFDKITLNKPSEPDYDPEDSEDNDSDEGEPNEDAPRKLRSHKNHN